MPKGFYERRPTKKTRRRNCEDHEFVPHPRQKFDCYICTRNFFNERARVNRAKLREEMNAYKVQQGCAFCGYNAHPAGLEFDHIEALQNPAQRKRVKVRIDFIRLIADPNIQVLCAICHRIKTWESGDYKPREIS